MRWNREKVKGFAKAYRDVVKGIKRDIEKRGIAEVYDIDAAFSHREDVLEHLDLADDETKEILKEADEIVLIYIDFFKEGGDLHYLDPSLFWHNYLDWVSKGKIEVVWNDKLKIYVGKVKGRRETII